MTNPAPIRQWDTYWADLSPVVGSEQGGACRPVLVVSNDGFNRSFQVVTIIPLTKADDKRRQVYSFEVSLPAGAAGNPLDSIVMPQQVRTISKMRLRGAMGTLASVKLREAVENRLLNHLGIELDDES